ncbi:KIF9 protein, partial [Pitta sordida]|nr:KIF9 protein [Pitta sordida]
KRVRAFVRVKPTAHFAQDMIKFGPDNKSIDIRLPKDSKGGAVNNSRSGWSFRLDGLLHNCSQERLYRTVAKGLVAGALQGYNGTIMCYGQTGAGKTYTMTGASCEYRQRGIIPRAIQQVFKEAAESTSLSIHVRISYLEIYNEALTDLLCPVPWRRPLAVLDGPRGVRVQGLSIHPVSHEEQALNLLFEARDPKYPMGSRGGAGGGVIAEHSLNKNSSRSHCIFTIYLECHSRVYTNLKHIKSKITLVDLAGSERLSQTRAEHQVRRESSYINKSLSFLEQLILALADPRREHIPFRQSKLTHVLKDSLGGNCNTVLVTNICGEAAHLEETLSSLRFATRMKWVRTEPLPNVRLDQEVSVKALEEEIRVLKQELAMRDMLENRPFGMYNPLSASQRETIRSQIHKYLRGTIQEIDIVNVRQIQEVFKEFKVIVSQQEEAVEAKLRSKYTLMDKDAMSHSSELSTRQSCLSGNRGIMELFRLEKASGTESNPSPALPRPPPTMSPNATSTGLGNPPRDVTPPVPGLHSPFHDGIVPNVQPEPPLAQPEAVPSPPVPSPVCASSCPPAEAEAFELFKREAGRELSRIFRENKAILGARRRRSNSVARRLNLIKREMEGIQEALETEKQKRWQEGEYTDEEGRVIIEEKEFSLLLRLQELKEGHRAGCAELQDLRAEIQYCQGLVDKCRKRLVSEFEIWYKESFLIPEDVREALEPGGSIRPGMIPINRVLCLEEDEQDKFERMQETNLPECPASAPFYRARMRAELQQTFNRTVSSLRKTHRKPGILTAAGRNKALSFLHVS